MFAEEYYHLLTPEEHEVAGKLLDVTDRARMFDWWHQDEERRFLELCALTGKQIEKEFARMHPQERIEQWIRLRHMAFLLTKAIELSGVIEAFAHGSHRQAFRAIVPHAIDTLLSPSKDEIMETTYAKGTASDRRRGKLFRGDFFASIGVPSDDPPEE